MDSNFLIIGNDEKMLSCKNKLNKLGFPADCFDKGNLEETISRYEYILLPLPTLDNGKIYGTDLSIDSFRDMLSDKQTVFCGNISPEIFSCKAISYYRSEDFLLKNSRFTAQGVLRLVLENIKKDLNLVSAAVIGYGRCGREICRTLKNAGADVTSFSRRIETFTLAESNGFHAETVLNINRMISNYDITVNTVPFNIIDSSGLKSLTPDNIYIEVASRPYGFCVSEKEKYDFTYVPAGNLPGRFTPVSAGYNIADTVAGIIKEGIKNE